MLNRSQMSSKTMMLAVAAAATNLAVASQLLHAPFLRRGPALLFVIGLFTVGVLLPALWVGGLRRLSHDALMGHLALVGLLVLFVFLAAPYKGGIGALFFAYVTVAVGVPSFAWYFVRGMEPGEPRDRAGRLAIACSKVAAQLAFGFACWLICFIALRQVVG